MNNFRPERIREFIIGYDEIYCHIRDGNSEKWVFVYTDESYVHQSHQTGNSYFLNGKSVEMNRSCSKGRRLIILHAITKDGPLAEKNSNGKPVRGELQWNGDTPHPTRKKDGPYTCETLWPADTHTGEYHDNMKSNIFLKWVEERLIPTFKIVYPDHRMCLVLDNAPYHHERPVGSLQSTSKKEIISIMIKDKVDLIDLP